MASLWDASDRARQAAIEIVMRNRDIAESRRRFELGMKVAQDQQNQKDQMELMKLVEKAKQAKIEYAQDMMKTAYEKGDEKGVQAFGEPLRQQGLPVPAEQVAGPARPGGLPPVRYFGAPQKQGMSEAELTQRAMQGDKLAQSILERMTQRKKETARAGASSVNVEVGEKSMTELGKEMSKDLVAERKDVQGAVASLENMKAAEDLLNSGMITGAGAEFLTNAGNLLASRLGFKAAEDPVANTQAFAATMGNQVGQIIKQFGSGTGLSDADREYAEKIVGGKITLNEKAIRRLLAINKKAYSNVIKRFNKKAEQAMKKPGSEQLPYDLRIDYKPEETKSRFKIIQVR